MLKRRDQSLLSEAYGQVGGGEVSAPSMMGKPVMITMDMPGAEVSTEHEDETDSMILSDLHKISKYALQIHDMVRDGSQLEDWEVSKLTKAAVYIADVHDSLEYGSCGEESQEMFNTGHEDHKEHEGCSYAAEGCTCGGCDECQ